MERYTSFKELKAAEESTATSVHGNPDAERSIVSIVATIRKQVVQSSIVTQRKPANEE